MTILTGKMMINHGSLGYPWTCSFREIHMFNGPRIWWPKKKEESLEGGESQFFPSLVRRYEGVFSSLFWDVGIYTEKDYPEKHCPPSAEDYGEL